jgi:hypothetical protein
LCSFPRRHRDVTYVAESSSKLQSWRPVHCCEIREQLFSSLPLHFRLLLLINLRRTSLWLPTIYNSGAPTYNLNHSIVHYFCYYNWSFPKHSYYFVHPCRLITRSWMMHVDENYKMPILILYLYFIFKLPADLPFFYLLWTFNIILYLNNSLTFVQSWIIR